MVLPDRQTAPTDRRRWGGGPPSPGPQLTLACSSDSWPEIVPPRSSAVPCQPPPDARKSRPDLASLASCTSPRTLMPSASSAGPLRLASRAPRSMRLPLTTAPDRLTAASPSVSPAASRPSRNAPTQVPPPPTDSPEAVRAGPERLARRVPSSRSSLATWVPASWIRPSGRRPSSSQPRMLSVSTRARLAVMAGSTQVSRTSHGSFASHRLRGLSKRHPVNRSPIAAVTPSRFSSPRIQAPQITTPRGSITCGGSGLSAPMRILRMAPASSDRPRPRLRTCSRPDGESSRQ